MYLLQALPSLLFPSGLGAALLTLATGFLLGLLGAAAGLVSPDTD